MAQDWRLAPIDGPDRAVMARAWQRQAVLTKPAGALGRLEELAVLLAGLQGRDAPALERVRVVVFAADHGVAAAGVSAYPQSVTVEMVRNFAAGGAAIAVLARNLGADLEVVDVGAAQDPGPLPGVISRRVAAGSADFRTAPALTPAQLDEALAAGREAVQRAVAAGAELLIGGEMGIGNTTAATAVACALLGQPAAGLTGPGTGLDGAGVAHKARVIEQALTWHQPDPAQPWEVLRRLGGLELAALAGTYLAAGQARLPVLVDGYIAAAAALVVVKARPEARPWLIFAHRSAEPGAQAVLEALQAQPVLDLAMRLGEGSGAAVALPILRQACQLHNQMATFAEAQVSNAVRLE